MKTAVYIESNHKRLFAEKKKCFFSVVANNSEKITPQINKMNIVF